MPMHTTPAVFLLSVLFMWGVAAHGQCIVLVMEGRSDSCGSEYAAGSPVLSNQTCNSPAGSISNRQHAQCMFLYASLSRCMS
jgi:hypothetical protein